jgi:Transposase DDE domain
VVSGRANYTNLSRYSSLSERTFRRNLNKGIGFESINGHLIETHGSRSGIQILVVDATFYEKSGRHTPNLDRFYNGKTGQVEKGLEWSVVAVVDLEQNTGYALSAQQTEAGLSERVKAAAMENKVCGNRVDFYLGHLAHCQTYVPNRVEYVVADSFYSKRKWVDGVVKLGWNAIGKLRQDANLKYLYQGPRRPGPGRQKTYDGKVNPLERSLNYFTSSETLEDGAELWTAVVWSVSLERRIRLVCLVRMVDGKERYILLFSTDVNLSASNILAYYRARFQIEFIFRDARQYTGMIHNQSRNLEAIDAQVNGSLTALNLAKATLRQELSVEGESTPEVVSFSIASFKRKALNEHLLDLFITMFGLDSTLIKLNPNYRKLLEYGSLRA